MDISQAPIHVDLTYFFKILHEASQITAQQKTCS